jgi:signal peptidase I
MVKEAIEKLKKYWKKFWFIVWKDNSLRGWIFSIIFLFIVIKFIFFPLLSLTTGTQLPLAIVESCSMYHQGNLLSNFDDWWQLHASKYSEIGINKTEFKNYIFKNGFNKGDILFIVGTKPKDIKIGDVIIFKANSQNPIIHRVISIKTNSEGKFIFSTEGDNNNGQLSVEQEIQENQIVGKAAFKAAPYLGWTKLIFFEGSRDPSQRGFCTQN